MGSFCWKVSLPRLVNEVEVVSEIAKIAILRNSEPDESDNRSLGPFVNLVWCKSSCYVLPQRLSRVWRAGAISKSLPILTQAYLNDLSRCMLCMMLAGSATGRTRSPNTYRRWLVSIICTVLIICSSALRLSLWTLFWDRGLTRKIGIWIGTGILGYQFELKKDYWQFQAVFLTL